jgi:DHA1 family tetracycline resistance protein-like MFS transporter
MSPLVSLFLFVLVDILGFSIVLPLFPYLSKEYGLNPTEIGLLQTSNAIAQLIAVPFIGILSDKYGRKPLLIICVLGTLVSFILLAQATTPFMLFFSRILDGILGGNISLAQAYIADVTTTEQRSKGMGILYAAFGLGFILGPAIGGSVVHINPKLPAQIAAGLSLINLISIIFFLKESLPKEKRLIQTDKSEFLPNLNAFWTCLHQPRLRKILWLRLCYGTVFTLFESTFGFYNSMVLNLDAKSNSYMLAFYGIVFSMVQARGVHKLTTKYGVLKLLKYSLPILAISYFASAFTSTYLQHALMMVPLGFLSGISNTLISTLVSTEVHPSIVGSTLGFSAALGSLTRIIAPTFGGWLVHNYNPQSPALASAAITLYLSYLAASLVSQARKQDPAGQKTE